MVWCLILLLSIPPIYGLTGFNIFEPSYGRWVSEEQSQVLRNVKKTFPNRFSGFPVFISALHRTADIIADEFRDSGGKDVVFWIGSLPQVTLFGTSPLLPEDVETLDEAQAVADVVASHPLVNGQLLSDDRRTMLRRDYGLGSGRRRGCSR